MSALILKRKEIEACVGFDLESLAAVEASFEWAIQPDTDVPQPLHLDVPSRDGSFDIKTAYVPGQHSITVKIASGFYKNAESGLPTGHSMMTVFSGETGFVEAMLLDEGYLTDLRTALAGAVAAKHLAKERLDTVGVVGTGAQACDQLLALRLVRDFQTVRVFGRTPAHVSRYCEKMEKLLHCAVIPADSVSALVGASDYVVTTTPAREPLIKAEAIRPGLHITAMGSDGPGKRELGAGVLARAEILVADLPNQSKRIGECQWLSEDRDIVALGDLVRGSKPGRTSDEAVTVCDLSGLGTQDSAIAQLVLARARKRGLGTYL